MIPIAPGDVYRSVFPEDMLKEDPPVFIFKALTAREQRKLSATPQKVGLIPDEAGFDLVFGVLRKYMLGWENIKQPFDLTLLEDVLSYKQALELIALQVLQVPELQHKKKSKSQSPSSGDSSAGDAKGQSASENSPTTTVSPSTAPNAVGMGADNV